MSGLDKACGVQTKLCYVQSVTESRAIYFVTHYKKRELLYIFRRLLVTLLALRSIIYNSYTLQYQ